MALNAEDSSSLVNEARGAASRATAYAWDTFKPAGFWQAELASNVSFTAEQTFLIQTLGDCPSTHENAPKYIAYFFHRQLEDGSWNVAPDCPGNVSITAETYLALKMLGVPTDAPQMRKAREFVRSVGGVAKVRVFTRIYFAMFGLFPWDALPELPAEMILLPPSVPLNIYTFASWARASIVPLLVIFHHRPIYALNGHKSADNDYLDELWLDPSDKMVPLPGDNDVYDLVFGTLDKILNWMGGMRSFPTRGPALKKCIQWILEHQEPAGDWAGILPPMQFGVQALLLEGYSQGDKCVRLGLEAIDRFHWEDENGKRMQSCVSPVWDTVLMTRGLYDAGITDARLDLAMSWTADKQLVGSQGDWKVYCKPNTIPGGFSFEHYNSWYPDVDDTAAVILAMLKQNPDKVTSDTVKSGLLWILAMQNKDGGWAAFDINNDQLWLNRLPFSDMDSLCDPSTADVTGRIIECFGTVLQLARNLKGGKAGASDKKSVELEDALLQRMMAAAASAIEFLSVTQELNGSWYGRWGVNYIYGTSHVLAGLSLYTPKSLASFAVASPEGLGQKSKSLMARGVRWTKRVQNTDGGWGEGIDSYTQPWRAGCGESTPSQTGWALMGLLASEEVGAEDDAVAAGIAHLVRTQVDCGSRPGLDAASWKETKFTGTGFPNHMHIQYVLYSHYFPLMALGRYLRKAGAVKSA